MNRVIRYREARPANAPAYLVIQTRKYLGYRRYYGPVPMWAGQSAWAKAKVLGPLAGPNYVLELVRWTAATEYQRRNAIPVQGAT